VTSGGDRDLLTGDARFAADVAAPGALTLVFVRSTSAHADVVDIDIAGAAAVPGVVGVFTADDLALGPLYEIFSLPERLAQPPLAASRVRFFGERLVAVVAESPATALDAAELVHVELEPLPAVVDVRRSLDPGAPLVFPEHGSNLVLEWELAAPDDTWDDGAVTVEGTLDMPRIAVAPLETLSVLAVPADDRVTVWASTQAPQSTRSVLAHSLGIAPEAVRVRTPRVGGGFGGKAVGGVADYVVTAAVASRLGRPVRCVEDRGANLALMHARGIHLRYALHARSDGALTALAVDELCDAGAYPSTNAVEPGKTAMMATGPYRLPGLRFRGRSALTNLAPCGAFRGPGRSEATALLERAMDKLARRLGMDPVDLRRRNLLTPCELPHDTPGGARYDESDYVADLDSVVSKGGYDALRRAQRRRSPGERPLGVGVASVVDSTAWYARREEAVLAVDRDGRVRVAVGTTSAGQNHAVALATIVAEVLPVQAADVDVSEGDTDEVPSGGGTSGSRSLQLAGSAVRVACEAVLDRARQVVADLLEAAVEDVVVAEAGLSVRGVPPAFVPWKEVAARGGLDARCVFDQERPTYPSAAHLAAVEVDPETGTVTPVRLVSVTACGRVVDPPGATGQVVGATAQGVAQVLFEQVSYDDAGVPRGTSLAEYLMPSAAELPAIDASFAPPSAAALNPLGAKGVGEIGMLGAPAALHGAVLDALAPFGVDELELPCTPERIWRAIHTRRPRS
jgi:carbon-monoxide dehydrogenase large subunit